MNKCLKLVVMDHNVEIRMDCYNWVSDIKINPLPNTRPNPGAFFHLFPFMEAVNKYLYDEGILVKEPDGTLCNIVC